ncbi:hypothetical protein GCM10022214_74630 [Actinomadura miaoliensis]|uniref:Uncharacterized protein n=1 Tax=Actinomadura miaoliensis TaxID=430685 RepID=A0ABP7WXV0_9ACTN
MLVGEGPGALRPPGRPGDLVARLHEHRDQPAPDNPGGTGDKDLQGGYLHDIHAVVVVTTAG